MKRKMAIALPILLGLLLISSLQSSVRAQGTTAQGKFFTLNIDYEPQYSDFAQVVASELGKIGINVALHSGEWTTIEEKVKNRFETYDEGGWDIWIDGAVPPISDPHYSLYYPEIYVKSLDYVNRQIKDLMYQAVATVNNTEATQTYKEIQRLFLEELPYIVNFFHKYPIVFPSKVANTDVWAKYYITSPGDRPGIIARTTYDPSGGCYVPNEDTIVYAQDFRVPNFLSIWGWAFVEAMFLRLVRFDPTTFEILPEIAQSWDISADGKTYTFHLRDGIVWSDGVPLTADECVWTYQFQMNPDAGSDNYGDLSAWIDSMEAPDSKTFVMHLKQSVRPFMMYLAGGYGYQIAPAHVLKDIPIDQLKTSNYNTEPNGPVSGWYKIAEHVEGEYTRYEVNEMLNTTYFNKPKNKNLLFKIVSDSQTALAGAEKGDLHVLSLYYGYQKDYPTLKDNTKLKVEVVTSVSLQMMRLNPKHPILSDRNVRKAIASALPIEKFVSEFRNGLEDITQVPVFPASPFYDHTLTGYAYDLDQAKLYMEKAGYNYAWLNPTEFPWAWIAASLVGGIVIGGVVAFGFLKLRKKK